MPLQFVIFKMRPKLGRILLRGDTMPKHKSCRQKTVKEYDVNGTRYIVTAHFKTQGSTATDHIRRMIDYATKENIKRKF